MFHDSTRWEFWIIRVLSSLTNFSPLYNCEEKIIYISLIFYSYFLRPIECNLRGKFINRMYEVISKAIYVLKIENNMIMYICNI